MENGRRRGAPKGVPYDPQHKICVICKRAFEEWGHNAEPIERGRCCNYCNDMVVIPERIRQMREAVKKGDQFEFTFAEKR